MSAEPFTLLPLTLPVDAREILRLHYQVHLSDTLYTKTAAPTPEEVFIETNLPGILSRFSDPKILAAKLVPSSSPDVMVAYIVWAPPATKKDERTQEEVEKDIRVEADGLGEGNDKEIYYALRLEDEALNKKFLGNGFETRLWELNALVVDENFQRKGLGTRLVKWGLEELEKRRERGVEGAYLIASPQGEKTYRNAGFERVGERVARAAAEGDVEGSYTHGWFVKSFE